MSNHSLLVIVYFTLAICIIPMSLSAEETKPGKAAAATKAFDRGQKFKRRGNFELAREQFEIARQIAPNSSSIAKQAEQELIYYLPLHVIQSKVHTGDLDEAEQQLKELRAVNQSEPHRFEELSTMLRNLRVIRDTSPAQRLSISQTKVIQGVRRVLEDYRRERGRYPPGYRELNIALPPNKPPLEQFLVARYHVGVSGYVLVLRSKHDPAHTLTLQNTGLLR